MASCEPVVIYHAAGGVVVRQVEGAEPDVLLLDRPTRGEVRLPKGHLDPEETPAQAALRETTEESGFADLEIVADLGEQVVEFHYQGKDVRRYERYYLMRLRSDRQVPRSPGDAAQFIIRWASLEQAASLLTFAPEQQRIHQAKVYLQETV